MTHRMNQNWQKIPVRCLDLNNSKYDMILKGFYVFYDFSVMKSNRHFGFDFSCFHSSIEIVKTKPDLLWPIEILFCFDNCTLCNRCKLIFTDIRANLGKKMYLEGVQN